MRHFRLKDFFELVFDTNNIYDIYIDGRKADFGISQAEIHKNHPDWLNLVIRKVIMRRGEKITDVSLIKDGIKIKKGRRI